MKFIWGVLWHAGVLIPYNSHLCCLLSWSEEIRTAPQIWIFWNPSRSLRINNLQTRCWGMLQRLVWEVQKMRSSGKLGSSKITGQDTGNMMPRADKLIVNWMRQNGCLCLPGTCLSLWRKLFVGKGLHIVQDPMRSIHALLTHSCSPRLLCFLEDLIGIWRPHHMGMFATDAFEPQEFPEEHGDENDLLTRFEADKLTMHCITRHVHRIEDVWTEHAWPARPCLATSDQKFRPCLAWLQELEIKKLCSLQHPS